MEPWIHEVGGFGEIEDFGVSVVTGFGIGGEVETGDIASDLRTVFSDFLKDDRDVGFVFNDGHAKAIHGVEDMFVARMDVLIMAANVPEVPEIQIWDRVMTV